jgi:tripartite-type tricarboxylate transporter receptor subunit TctC
MSPVRALVATLCAVVMFDAGIASAQNYPNRPVRIVVPYISGGAGDGVARTLSQRLTDVFGQSVYIDNRPGGGTKIGTEIVAKSPPNGLTLLMATNASTINVSLYPKMSYDLMRDLAPVTLIDQQPNVLVVHTSLPVRSVKDLVTLAKARPGELNFASSGIAGSVHFAGELFKSMAGINIVHVPYRGFAQALTDLLSGQVPMSFSTMQSATPHVRAGRIRALAVTSKKRSVVAPDLPTMAEAGVPGYEMVTWHAFLAPAGTPADIVARIQSETLNTLKVPEIRSYLEGLGMDLIGSTPGELGDFMKSEIVKYRQLIQAAGIKPE